MMMMMVMMMMVMATVMLFQMATDRSFATLQVVPRRRAKSVEAPEGTHKTGHVGMLSMI
jgi:hypothetical protein